MRSPPLSPSEPHGPGKIRIIAGKFRSRKLSIAPEKGSYQVRPTSNRSRETLFNWLNARVGEWSKLEALDLFAGSGALGIEALSRGADSCTFIEVQPHVVKQLYTNQTMLALNEQQMKVICLSAWNWLASIRNITANLVFIDPPFEGFDRQMLLQKLANMLADGTWVALEQPIGEDLQIPVHWELVKQLKTKATKLSLYQTQEA